MSPPDLSRIIFPLRDPVLLVEPAGTVVAANFAASTVFRQSPREFVGKPLAVLVTDHAEKLTRYLRQCLQKFEGIPGGLNIRPSNEPPITRKVLGGLAHHRAEQPSLVWLRLVASESANTRFAGYNERLQTLAEENRAQQHNEQRWRTAFENSAIGVMMVELQPARPNIKPRVVSILSDECGYRDYLHPEAFCNFLRQNPSRNGCPGSNRFRDF